MVNKSVQATLYSAADLNVMTHRMQMKVSSLLFDVPAIAGIACDEVWACRLQPYHPSIKSLYPRQSGRH